jgi:hypothetical protein
LENAVKKEAEKPQEINLIKKEGKVINMVSILHMKTYEDVDFSKILIDCGIRHCAPHTAGLLF